MSKVSMSSRFPVSANKMWDTVGGFGALSDWHPAVEKTELEEDGKLRRLTLVGGGEILERLEGDNPTERTYRYSILKSPLPVAGYVSELKVRDDPDGKGCTVEWSSEFQPAGADASEAEKVIRGIYQAGLENLRKLMGA